jgi:4-hydroxy-tetrahydrodipicolinate reductase
MFKPGEVEHMFWEVEGKPRTRVRVERDDSAHATAGNLFNRIPDIIAAPPGIVPVYQLGPLKSTCLV